jgi:HAD superfamily hydrolase (TIGR01548 family)
VAVTSAQVAAAIRTGDAANDWLVTRHLVEGGGRGVSLDGVTARFQSLYLGDASTPGLRERERLIPPSPLLERFAARQPLAIVTGRPRAEAQWFLERAGVAQFFGTVVAMEDARAKPDPAPVRLALERLGVRRAWMIGDTPDDMRAAAQAGVLPVGVVSPGDEPSLAVAALREAGAARVLDRLSDLLVLLP